MNSQSFSSRSSQIWRVAAVAALVTAAGCSEPAPPPAPAAPTPPPARSAEARVQAYQACWDQFNNKQWDQFQNCYSENAVSESVDATPPSATGRAAIIERDKAEAVAFPDRRGEVRVIMVNGDHLASIALYTATNTGEMPGPDGKPMKPTGKPIGLLIAHILDLDSTGMYGVRDAGYVEQGTMMAQLGLNPAPARKAEKPSGAPTQIAIAKNDASEKANIDATRASFDAFNKHDLKALEASTPDDYKFIEIGQARDMDKKASLANLRDLFAAFPDVTLSTPTVWAAGDYVVIEGTFSGTNTGPLKSMGLPKTGKKVTSRFCEVIRFENGKPREDWLFYNGAAFAAQLGLK